MYLANKQTIEREMLQNPENHNGKPYTIINNDISLAINNDISSAINNNISLVMS